MRKPSAMQAPTNHEDYLNIQDVKSFLILWLFQYYGSLTPSQQYLIHPLRHWLSVQVFRRNKPNLNTQQARTISIPLLGIVLFKTDFFNLL